MPSSNPRYAKDWSARDRRRRTLLRTETVCAICHKPIDPLIRTPDPMSAEVDEENPISNGGDPLDWDNLRLVHRRCNQRKGAKVRPERVRELPITTSRRW